MLSFVTLCYPLLPFFTTVASQPLDKILLPWLVNPHSPALTPHCRQATYWWNRGRKKNKGWEGGKTLNETLDRPLHKCSTKNSQILAVTEVPSTMWGCRYGIECWMPSKLVGHLTTKLVDLLDGLTCGPLKFWTAKLVDPLTAKLMNHLTAKLVHLLTAKLVNRLTAKLVNRLTAKLVVVNLVKLHLTKSIMIIRIIFNKYSSEKAIMLLFTDG